MVQPRRGGEGLRWQRFKPLRQGFAAALFDHGIGRAVSDFREPAPVGTADQQCHGVLHLPGIAQQRRRQSQVRRRQQLRSVQCRTVEQEIAHQGMQLKTASLGPAHFAHEVIVQGQVQQQPGCFRLAREFLRQLGRDARQAGELEQELLHLAVEALEDLPGQEIEHHAWRGFGRPGRQLARQLGVFEHEHQACRPAAGALMQLLYRFRRQGLPAQSGDLRQLVGVQCQHGGVDARHLASGLQPRQRRRGVEAAGDDHRHTRAHLAKCGLEHQQQRAFRHQRADAVEHHGERSLGTRKGLAEEFARERREAARVFRRIGGQAADAGGVEPQRSLAEVVEEGRHVRVVVVHFIPEATALAVFHVAGGQRGLAGAGWARDPHQLAQRRVVHALEQPGARHDRAELRARGLGESHAAAFVGFGGFGGLGRSHGSGCLRDAAARRLS